MSFFQSPNSALLQPVGLGMRQRGFTLIELITVIIILGILAVYAAPRMLNVGSFEARGFHDETLALLRYAQKTAIAQRRTVCVALNSTGVTLTMDTSTSTPPGGGCIGAPTLPNTPRGGGTSSTLGANVGSFKFSSLGGTDQVSNVAITISNSTAITVEAATGYVHE